MDKRKIIFLILPIFLVSALTISVVVLTEHQKQKEEDQLPLYTVSFDTKGGSSIADVQVKEGKKISKPVDPTKKGFTLTDWLYGNNSWEFDVDVVTRDMTLTATWDYVTYTITYNFNGGSTEETYTTTYNVDSSFALIRPFKFGSVFVGWFDQNGHRIDDIEQGMTGDLLLTANYVDNLVLTSLDETRGTIVGYADEDNPNLITVENVPVDNKYHVFLGWEDENGNLLSEESSYTFEINNQEVTYVNARYMDDNQEHEWNIVHGVIPTYTDENKDHVKYGLYPQHNVNDGTLIEKLESLKVTTYNDYFYYDHEYYTKKIAQIYVGAEGVTEIRRFDNGDEFAEGDSYWFAVEPIVWRILETDATSLLLLSDVTTETVEFNGDKSPKTEDEKTIYPNNYEHSNARNWLNNEFLNNSFVFGKSAILKTIVDNSISTTNIDDEKYISDNTEDNIFLLSYKDYTNECYGFSSLDSNSNTRQLKSTDYFRVSNGYYGTSTTEMFASYLWTRSPMSDDGLSVNKINRSGGLNHSDGNSHYCGLQPAMRIERI